MAESTHPAEPADDKRLETLAEIARILNERFPPTGGRKPVSRQLLHKAWRNRHSPCRGSGFPAHGSGREGHPLFWVHEVVEWYTVHRRYRIDGTTQNGLTGSAATHSSGEDTTLAA
jgi:hypothetical protein